MTELLLGVHLSVSGGIENVFKEAERLGINVFQVFLGSPRGWQVSSPSQEKIELFRKKASDYKFINVHAPYLLNFATEKEELFEKSLTRAIKELKIMALLGIEYYVIHPGSSSAKGGTLRVRKAIERILNTVPEGTILVENLSGEKNDVGKNLGEVMEIIDGFEKRVGICLDTCHLFSSGVDIRDERIVDDFYRLLEKHNLTDKVKMIHANDSKKAMGSGIDRHEHIGKGEIGEKGFFNLFHHPFFRRLPYILETPKDNNGDEMNLMLLKKLFNAKKF